MEEVTQEGRITIQITVVEETADAVTIQVPLYQLANVTVTAVSIL